MNEDEIYKKCKFYLDGIKVHIKRNKDKGFYNGHVKEVLAEFIMFNDSVLGDLPVFYSEIEDIEPFTEKRWKIG